MKRLIGLLQNQARELIEDYAYRMELLDAALRELDETLELLEDLTAASEEIYRKFTLALLYLHDAKLFEKFNDQSKD